MISISYRRGKKILSISPTIDIKSANLPYKEFVKYIHNSDDLLQTFNRCKAIIVNNDGLLISKIFSNKRISFLRFLLNYNLTLEYTQESKSKNKEHDEYDVVELLNSKLVIDSFASGHPLFTWCYDKIFLKEKFEQYGFTIIPKIEEHQILTYIAYLTIFCGLTIYLTTDLNFVDIIITDKPKLSDSIIVHNLSTAILITYEDFIKDKSEELLAIGAKYKLDGTDIEWIIGVMTRDIEYASESGKRININMDYKENNILVESTIKGDKSEHKKIKDFVGDGYGSLTATNGPGGKTYEGKKQYRKKPGIS